MKKYLLIGASAIALGVGTGAAQAADAPALTVHGTWFEYFGYQDTGANARPGGAGSSVTNFWQGDLNALSFGASEKLDNGITVAGTINLDTNRAPLTPPNTPGGGAGAAALGNSFVTVSGSFGTFEVGMDTDVLANYLVETPNPSILVGNSPLLGVWAPSVGINVEGDTAFFDQGSAYGVRYTTPSFSGFQAAIDFMPPSGGGVAPDGGITQTNAAQAAGAGGYAGISPGIGNQYDALVMYKGKFGDVDFSGEAGYGSEQRSTVGAAVAAAKYTITGIQVGASVTFKGLTVGGAFVNRSSPTGVAGVEKVQAKDGNSWDIGAEYDMGPWLIAASYYADSGVDAAAPGRNDSRYWADVTGGYNLGPGVKLTLTGYEVHSHVNTGGAGDVSATDTGVVMGTLVNF